MRKTSVFRNHELLIWVGAVLLFILFAPQLAGAQTPNPGDTKTITMYAAQLAVGWDGPPNQPGSMEWVTLVTYINRSPTGHLITYDFYDDGGKIRGVTRETYNGNKGPSFGGYASISSMSQSTRILSNLEDDSTTSVGWIKFQTTATFSEKYGWLPDIETQVVYQWRDSEGKPLTTTSVTVMEADTSFLVHGIINHTADTALAYVNPNHQPVEITLKIYDYRSPGTDGLVFPYATKRFTLGPNCHLAEFLSQRFADLRLDILGNRLTEGTLEIESDLPIAITAIRSDTHPGTFVIGSIPVFPGRR